VPASEQAGQRQLQRRVLADDDAPELLDDQRQSFRYGDRIALGGSHGHRQSSPLQVGFTGGAHHYRGLKPSSHDRWRRATLRSTAPVRRASPALRQTQEITR